MYHWTYISRNYLDTLLTVGVPGQQGPAQVSYRNTVDAFINANIFRQRQDTVERRACSTVSNIVDGFKRCRYTCGIASLCGDSWRSPDLALGYDNCDEWRAEPG